MPLFCGKSCIIAPQVAAVCLLHILTGNFHVSVFTSLLATTLLVLFLYYIYIFRYVVLAVHKALPLDPEYLLQYINVLLEDVNNNCLQVQRLYKKQTRAPEVTIVTIKMTAVLYFLTT